MHTDAPSSSRSSSRPARGAASRQTSAAEAFPHASEDPETWSTPLPSSGASTFISSGCKSGTTCILSGIMTPAEPRRASWSGGADVARARSAYGEASLHFPWFNRASSGTPRAARYRAKRSGRRRSPRAALRRSRFPASGGAWRGQCHQRDLSVEARARVRQRARSGRHIPLRVAWWSREQLRATDRGVRFWERPKRPSGSRVRAHDGELRSGQTSRVHPLAPRGSRFETVRAPARHRVQLLDSTPRASPPSPAHVTPSQNRRPRARLAGTTRFSSSPRSSPSPPSFLPSGSRIARHPTAPSMTRSTALHPDARSSRRCPAATTPVGSAGADGRFTPSPSCTSSWASPSSATTSSPHRSRSSARN